ncbi:MAG: hypothetical protein LAO18_23870 [Acidobacteriia bacterium]|nr:hypothetical protein [Terriglobia bacterium]
MIEVLAMADAELINILRMPVSIPQFQDSRKERVILARYANNSDCL